MHIFDPYDSYFREPGGAIQLPGAIRLRLKLRRGEAVGAWVFCRLDGGEAERSALDFIGVTGAYDIYECKLSFTVPGLYWYHFQIDSRGGGFCSIPEHPEGEGFQISAYESQGGGPAWMQGGVIYHIFVDRFRRGGTLHVREGAVFREDWDGVPHYLPDAEGIVKNNDFFGGDLYGIIEKLPYLSRLGVSCIYLSPVFEAASNHKYDTGDFLKIDSGFGGDAAFEALLKAAAERGIRVILDGVFNHVGVDSRYFNRYGRYADLGAYQDRASPYYGWFHFQQWPDNYDAWWGIELLPALNKGSEAYRDFICSPTGVIAHWMKKGVSGWRLDVVDELPDVFLDPLCAAIKREREDAFIAGEVWEDASNKVAYGVRRRYFQGGQLDSVMNYPLKDAIIAFVKEGDAPRLAAVMKSLCQNYPEHVLNGLMNVLGSHDTMRILTVLGAAHFPGTKQEMEHYRLDAEQLRGAKERLKLAAALQFTLPGVPCVYYGDEAGMEGGGDPFCRRGYPWGQEDQELIGWYTALARLRREKRALKDGGYTLIRAKDGVFAFTRGQGRERILVVVNASAADIVLDEAGFRYNLLEREAVERMAVRRGEAAVFAVG